MRKQGVLHRSTTTLYPKTTLSSFELHSQPHPSMTLANCLVMVVSSIIRTPFEKFSRVFKMSEDTSANTRPPLVLRTRERRSCDVLTRNANRTQLALCTTLKSPMRYDRTPDIKILSIF